MKRLSIMLLASALMFSCNKAVPEISDFPFKVSVHYTATSGAWFDVVPENNDFHWCFDVVSVSDYNAKGSVEACISDTDKQLRELYELGVEEGWVEGSFSEIMLYRGSYLTTSISLASGEKYIAYFYAYDSDDKPTGKYKTLEFTTAKYVSSDITFSLSLTGSELTFTPSNDDPYCWTYDLKENVLKDWGEDYQYGCYVVTIANYINYGLLDYLETKGPYTEDLSEYVKIKEGDKLFVFVSGYNHDINSDIYKFECTYAGEGKEGTVVYVDKYSL